MTNEEAIKVLNDPTFTDYLWRVEQEEAIELATKALEQQKVGHQIPVIDTRDEEVTTVGGYKCSICGNFDGMKTKYCCECGAKFDKTYDKTHLSSVYGKEQT